MSPVQEPAVKYTVVMYLPSANACAMSGLRKSRSSSSWAAKNRAPAAPTFTGSETRSPFLSIKLSVQIPTAAGLTVKVATSTELLGGLDFGALSGEAVAHPAFSAVTVVEY